MNRPFLHTLKKIKNNLIQHELSEAERRDNVLGVYGVLNSELFAEKKLLLIDDICTTGSTLSECCRVLRNAGAAKTECAVIASAGENDVKISEGEDNDEEFDVFLE